jgi:hypothetical protein
VTADPKQTTTGPINEDLTYPLQRQTPVAGSSTTLSPACPDIRNSHISKPEADKKTMSESAKRTTHHRARLQWLHVLDQVPDLRITATEREEAVVVLYDIAKRCETPVVIEATVGVRPQSLQRSRTVAIVRRATGLEIVDSDLLGSMHISSGLGE